VLFFNICPKQNIQRRYKLNIIENGAEVNILSEKYIKVIGKVLKGVVIGFKEGVYEIVLRDGEGNLSYWKFLPDEVEVIQ